MFSNIEIGTRISSARNMKCLTLEDVASKVGVAKTTIMRYEKGTISKIKLPVIESIAHALEVDPNWIIGNTDVPFTSFSTPAQDLKPDEASLLEDYRSMNAQGQAAAQATVRGLADTPIYKRNNDSSGVLEAN